MPRFWLYLIGKTFLHPKIKEMPKLLSEKITLLLLAALVSSDVKSQGITLPRTPSPAAEVTQTIGISTVTVKYSRPSVKGREVWGNLVPYGWTTQGFGSGTEAPWRAGANENTTIRLSHDARIEGKTVPAG